MSSPFLAESFLSRIWFFLLMMNSPQVWSIWAVDLINKTKVHANLSVFLPLTTRSTCFYHLNCTSIFSFTFLSLSPSFIPYTFPGRFSGRRLWVWESTNIASSALSTSPRTVFFFVFFLFFYHVLLSRFSFSCLIVVVCIITRLRRSEVVYWTLLS